MGFIITFVLMMLAIIVLSGTLQGCTQLDRSSADNRTWSIEVIGTPEECHMVMRETNRISNSDDSLTIEHPKGAGK